MLEVSNLRVEFVSNGKSVVPVDDVSLRVGANEIVGLLGESGCGKSVTALSILRLFPKTSQVRLGGRIRWNGNGSACDLLQVDEASLRGMRGNDIAMIFQEPMTSLNPLHRIGKQCREMLEIHTDLTPQEINEQVLVMLQQVGLSRPEQLLEAYPHQLSGGMRQRVMIAMALLCRPALLICDEPTTALDVTIQAQILALMRKLGEERGTAILLITHDLGVVAEMCERVVVMYAGQVVEQSTVRALFDAPAHPYTRALMLARPALDAEPGMPLTAIPGAVPLPGSVTSGCRFAARCAQVQERCRTDAPELKPVDLPVSEHLVRCWYPC
ncbi:peptide/nickel transport system ATP-binding protein [Herbaspirillum sp. Sphag1AN]|uniref:ABC transporter ATP-binding protein n=1 Tax=unclassified Herbaspirillum TaxID=2624150 RepID=UPI00161C510A|nr:MULTISPECIES: ABC transporter ATP-binding protein [unclassified Herbaspirillum]MBB3214447.1 peptide/nickel transport system ATP-binding protein [Herbaspirillum sp. Sphag1AN]MBB3247449.1 peptide/nickel transport system ATP-binding protein [Herbaspirillum sp. Sphag64]